MALVETFTDSFTDTSAWESLLGYPVFPVVSNQLSVDVSFGVCAMESVGDYDCHDSWISLNVTNWYLNPTTSGYYAYVIGFGTLANYITLYVDSSGVASVNNAAVAVELVGAELSADVVIALREVSGSCYSYYSTDAGATWTFVGVQATAFGADPNKPFIFSNTAGTDSGFALEADDWNLHAPPIPDPMTTYTNAGHITLSGVDLVPPPPPKAETWTSSFDDDTGITRQDNQAISSCDGELEVHGTSGDTYSFFSLLPDPNIQYDVTDTFQSIKIHNFGNYNADNNYSINLNFSDGSGFMKFELFWGGSDITPKLWRYNDSGDFTVPTGTPFTIGPSDEVVLAWSSNSTQVAMWYSLDSGSSWTMVAAVDHLTVDGPARYLSFNSSASTGLTADYDISFDDLGLLVPPSPPVFGTTIVNPGIIDLSTGPVVHNVAPMEALTDDFASTLDYAKWGAGSFGTGVALPSTFSGELLFSIPSAVSGAASTIFSNRRFDIGNSWMSVKVKNFADMPTNTQNILQFLVHDYNRPGATTAFNGINVVYDRTTHIATPTAWTFDGGSTFTSHSGSGVSVTAGVELDLAVRQMGGKIYYYHSIDHGATWTLFYHQDYTNTGGTNVLTERVQFQCDNAGTLWALHIDDVSLLVPPDPHHLMVDPGVIDLNGVLLDGVSMKSQLQSFTDSFPNLTQWDTPIVTNTTITAAGTLDFFHASGATPSGGTLVSLDTYRVPGSWTSVKIVNMGDMPSNTLNNTQLTVQNRTGTLDYYAISLAYNTTTHLVTPTASRSISSSTTSITGATFSRTTGQSFHIGIRQYSGGVNFLYSLDAGTTWVQFATMPWIQPGGSGDLSVVLTNQVNAPGSNYTLSMDDLALLEPANINIVSTAAATHPAFSGVAIDLLHMDWVFTTGFDTIAFSGVTITGLIFGPPCQQVTPANINMGGVGLVGVNLSVGPPVIAVTPGEINLLCIPYDPIVGSYVLGDPLAGPLRIRESGSMTFATGSMTLESGEPATALTKSTWIEYTADGPMTVTVTGTGSGNFILEAMHGDSFDTMTVEAATTLGSSNTLTIPVVTGHTYFRITTSSSFTVSLLWSYVTSASDLMVDALTPTVDRTPGDFRCAVIGGSGGETMHFTWSPPVSTLITGAVTRPITLANITADPEGNVYIGTLPIPAVFAGTYVVNVKGMSSGKIGSVSFVVEHDPLPQDTGGTDATPVPQTTNKWLWDDGRGHTWVMDNNPDKMLSLVNNKVLLAERTTAGNGQHVIWNGATPAVDWGFTGTMLTEADYNEFDFFYGLNRKFYITTHRGNCYIVTFKNLDVTPHKAAGANSWAQNYTAGLFLFGEKV